jgi:hypothetical protein
MEEGGEVYLVVRKERRGSEFVIRVRGWTH